MPVPIRPLPNILKLRTPSTESGGPLHFAFDHLRWSFGVGTLLLLVVLGGLWSLQADEPGGALVCGVLALLLAWSTYYSATTRQSVTIDPARRRAEYRVNAPGARRRTPAVYAFDQFAAVELLNLNYGDPGPSLTWAVRLTPEPGVEFVLSPPGGPINREQAGRLAEKLALLLGRQVTTRYDGGL